jgi:septal ring factor EnvC (AmiA/AmiB activator)
MERETLEKKLATLERKLRLLLNEHQNLQLEVSRLKEENGEMKQLLKAKEDQVEGYKNKVHIHKIANSVTAEEGESAEMKQKLSEYIKKIDLCIAHLSE